MKFKWLLLLLVSNFIVGCIDMVKSKEIEIVGNISLINPNIPEDSTLRMVYIEDRDNRNLIDENVIQVCGNDSLLFVKSCDTANNTKYYKVQHKNGNSPVTVFKITIKDFTDYIASSNCQYSYPK